MKFFMYSYYIILFIILNNTVKATQIVPKTSWRYEFNFDQSVSNLVGNVHSLYN